jgi:hypothetical protein
MTSPESFEPSIKEITDAWSTYKNAKGSSTPEAAAARRRIALAGRTLAEEVQDPVEKLYEFSFYVCVNHPGVF